MTICKQLLISGRVQGVFFRHSTFKRAQKIGQLSGWVKNLSDGRVEVLVQGPAEQAEQLVAYCHKGPPAARVDSVDIQNEVPAGDLPDFHVSH